MENPKPAGQDALFNDLEYLELELIEFDHADGNMTCQACEQPYRRHPFADEYPGYGDEPFLRRLCDGSLVKL